MRTLKVVAQEMYCCINSWAHSIFSLFSSVLPVVGGNFFSWLHFVESYHTSNCSIPGVFCISTNFDFHRKIL